MKQSMKKAALVLMLALAVLLVPQWSNTALAVTTPSDITTGSDLPPAPPLPTPPAKGEVVISGGTNGCSAERFGLFSRPPAAAPAPRALRRAGAALHPAP